MNRLAFCSVAVMAVTLMTACAECGKGETGQTASVSAARCMVVYPDAYDSAPSAIRLGGKAAAKDLAVVLSKVTGASIEVRPESSVPPTTKNVVYIGDTKAAAAAGLDAGVLKANSFRLVAVPGRVFVLSRTQMGASAGVTHLVEHYCGYTFATVSTLEDPYDVNPALVIPCMDETVVPAIYCHRIYIERIKTDNRPLSKAQWPNYIRRRRLDVSNEEIEPEERLSKGPGKNCHSTFHFVPPEKYFKEHPEYFSMNRKGVRQAKPVGQICYTNPEVRDIVTSTLVDCIRRDRKANPTGYPHIYDVSHEDNTNFLCLCPECRKVIAKYNRTPENPECAADENRHGGDTGLQLEFINDIAGRVAREYPDVVLRVFAYVSTEEPPNGDIRPADNVMIWMTDLYSKCDHHLPLLHPFNKPRADLIRYWLGVSKHFELWDYFIVGPTMPEIGADAFAADAKFFRKIGLRRLFQEAELRGGVFFELNNFLMDRLYWNPDEDVDALVKTYCRAYGRGAPAMERAVNYIRRALREQPPEDVEHWFHKLLPWRTLGFYDELKGMLDEAYAAAETKGRRAKVAEVLACVSKERARILKASIGKDAERLAALEDYRRYAVEFTTAELADPAAIAKAAKPIDDEFALENLRFDDLPDELASAPECDIRCLDWHKLTAAKDAVKAADPDSPSGKAAFWRLGRDDQLSGGAVPCGVWDFELKRGKRFDIPIVAGDEKYHWVRLGVARIGRTCSFWTPSDWFVGFKLSDDYVNCDGAVEDVNWREFWVSVKFQGPAYRKGSAKPNAFCVDRLVMRKVKEPR